MTNRIQIILPMAAISLAAAAAKGTYQNPDTVPVQIEPATYTYTYQSDYHVLPSTIDLAKCYREMTTPGPVLTFTINTPEDSGYPDTFRLQVWWVDPDPETPVTNDNNTTSDDDDTRAITQNLDLTEFLMIPYLIAQSIGTDDGRYSAILPGTIFWRNRVTDDDDLTHWAVEAGIFAIDDDSTEIKYSYVKWNTSPLYLNTDYNKGTVGFFYTNPSNTLSSTSYAETMFFNLVNNNNRMDAGTVGTFGKVFDDDIDTLRCISNSSTEFSDTTETWDMGTIFKYIPLWYTYTDEEYDLYDEPETSDYAYIKSITMSDPSGSYPTTGLKFLEDISYVSDSDSDDDGQGDMVYPNDDFGRMFDYTLSPEGVLSLTPKDNLGYTEDLVGSAIFYFRVYVDDGTNDGTSAPYFRTYATVTITRPFYLYLDATISSKQYRYDEDGNKVLWEWFSESTFGWYLVYNFPTNRWVYSYEHGWVYMCGESILNDEGVYWYDAPSCYDGVSTVTDDEVGWIWTNAEYFPFFWSCKDDGWVWYYKDVDEDSTDNDEGDDYVERILDKRLFWSYRQGKYITPSGFGAGLTDWWTR